VAETAAIRSFDEDIGCGVISLKRTPERLAHFLELNGPTGIDFQVLEAIDGSALSDEELMPPEVLKPGSIGYSRGAIGNALSHRKLWDRAIETSRKMLVFEDDAYIRRDLKTALPPLLASLGDDFDYLTLACNTDSIVHIEYVGGTDAVLHFTVPYLTEAGLAEFVATTRPVGAFRMRNSFGTCGYVVTPEGAAKLKAAVFPLDNRSVAVPGLKRTLRASAFDFMMNATYRSIRAYACVPPLVLSMNEKGKRTI
jgi:GR25 family glycosyltransferase involved in LPS biosynthesis